MMVFLEALGSVNLKMSHGKSEGRVHKSTYDCVHVCVDYFQRNSDQAYGKPYVRGGRDRCIQYIKAWKSHLVRLWSDCVEGMGDSSL